MDQLNIPDIHHFHKKHGFGPIFFGDVDGQRVRIRKLQISEISTVLVREIPAEIRKWKKVNFPSIENYLGEYHETDQNYYLISEANESMVSLATFLESDSNSMTTTEKVFVCKNLVKSMMQLAPLGDEYSHGHLCPNNILVE